MDVYSSTLSSAADIGAGCFLLFVGNLLVLVMAAKRASRMKPPELLSVNLAVTDLGAAVTMYPLAVASALRHRWLGGDATCVYYAVAGFFFGIASIMSLTALAVVRFIVSLNLQSPSRGNAEKRTLPVTQCHNAIVQGIAVLISLGFVVCWSPYAVVSMWSVFHDSASIPPGVSLLPCLFAKSSTVYNPLIYYIFSQSFRKEVKQLWLSLASALCHVSNAANVTNAANATSIYMVSTNAKSNRLVMSPMPETPESHGLPEGFQALLDAVDHLHGGLRDPGAGAEDGAHAALEQELDKRPPHPSPPPTSSETRPQVTHLRRDDASADDQDVRPVERPQFLEQLGHERLVARGERADADAVHIGVHRLLRHLQRRLATAEDTRDQLHGKYVDSSSLERPAVD
ncbi:Opsin-5 [Liparis tanakae]|uniref:Opsin-5 n=1 Tax=Liparis tanakae TaxID=230148 RepID=A0A4Z2FH27_9TELE|nr:Opsin-5 [Liparis tanakae]